MQKITSAVLKGGCDIDAISFYLKNTFVKEGSYLDDAGNKSYLSGHSVVLSNIAEEINWKHKYPFIDSSTYESSIFKTKYDCVIFSILADRGMSVYLDKTSKKYLMHGFLGSPILNSYKDLEFIGRTPPEIVFQNFKTIIKKLPSNTKIGIILGPAIHSELKETSKAYSFGAGAEEYFISVNSLLKKELNNNNIVFFDPNKYLTVKRFKRYFYYNCQSIAHYKRKVYYNLAKDIQKEFPLYFRATLKNEFIRDLKKVKIFLTSLLRKIKSRFARGGV